jgi:predicted ArsR family transcriptional regulator
MKSHEVKEIIDRLINAGEIQEVEIKVGGKGRPAKRFVAVDPNYFEE